jgi:hypothetical protein
MPDRTISSFDDLLREARQQPEPQRLLFVFAGAALPDDSTPEQQRRYAAGAGGALVPLMCVDKVPDELRSFSELVEESRSAGPEWVLVFVASLAGRGGHAPSSADAEGPLRSMVESIKSGAHGSFIPFDVEGRPVRLE